MNRDKEAEDWIAKFGKERVVEALIKVLGKEEFDKRMKEITENKVN